MEIHTYKEVSACGCEPEATAPATPFKALFRCGGAAEFSCCRFLVFQRRGIYWWSGEGGQCHQLYFKPVVCNYPFFPEGIIQVFSLSWMHNLSRVPISKSLSRKRRNRLEGLFKWKDGKNLGFISGLSRLLSPDREMDLGPSEEEREQGYNSAGSDHSHEKADQERSHAHAKLPHLTVCFPCKSTH